VTSIYRQHFKLQMKHLYCHQIVECRRDRFRDNVEGKQSKGILSTILYLA